MFEREGDYFRVRSWIKEGISWHCADAGDPELVSILGRQDVVVANRFLCHMDPSKVDASCATSAAWSNPVDICSFLASTSMCEHVSRWTCSGSRSQS